MEEGGPCVMLDSTAFGLPFRTLPSNFRSRRHDYANLAISFIESLAARQSRWVKSLREVILVRAFAHPSIKRRLAGKGDVFAGHVLWT